MAILDSYKILGIDPGTNILGYALIEIEKNKIKVLTFDVIKLSGEEDHHNKLKEIYLQLQEIIETYLPKHMAIEAPFFGKNVQSMLKLGRAQGVAMAAAITMGVDIFEYSPKKIKQSVTGNGNASKEQVHAMLQNILKINIEVDHLDATDALATAFCHFNQAGHLGSGEKKYSGWKSFVKNNQHKIQ